MLVDAGEDSIETLKQVKMTQEKIEGVSKRWEEMSFDECAEMEQFIMICLDYFISTYDSDRDMGMSIDFNKNNLIFGHKQHEERQRLYFIDTSEPIREFPKDMFIEWCYRELSAFGDIPPSLFKKIEDIVAM